MAYETKSAYRAVYQAVLDSKTIDEALKKITFIANAEGVVIPPRESSETTKDPEP